MNPDAEIPVEPTSPPEPAQAGGAAPEEPPEVPPLIARALEAFRRDLPGLMERHRGQWVAYHGDRQLGIARENAKLYKLVNRLGLRDDEYTVEWIGPQVEEGEEIEGILWEFDEPELDEEADACP
jgi:hypothetical protein